jgi:hypothetical protein
MSVDRPWQRPRQKERAVDMISDANERAADANERAAEATKRVDALEAQLRALGVEPLSAD